MRYIEDFKEDEIIMGHYLCKQKQSLKSRTGKAYLSVRLQDKTGQIDAKIWDVTNDIQDFEDNDFVKIEGTVTAYQNELQLKVKRLRRSMQGEYDEADYIPCTDKDVNSLYDEVSDVIRSIENPFIHALLENIFFNNDDIRDKFKRRSAAKAMHHNYMGGLIEHSLSVVQICEFMSTRYKFVNRDILVATAMLHDIGKIYELSEFPDNDYTDDGQLLGHIIMGTELITAEAAKIEGFPPQLASILKHCILAHHGEYEYGSPKKPKTIEAFILHCADNMDAKIKMYETALDENNTKGSWVGYNRMLAVNIRKSDF